MKNVLGAFILGLLFFTSYAQVITANDSISTGTNYAEMVFYSLSTGVKTSSSSIDWHLAVTVRPTQFPSAPLGGTTIRCNEAYGVHVYISPTANAASFNTLDTTGWQNWQQLHDSDSSIDMGAFNSNRNTTNIFDFGWGMYNDIVHNVDGDSIFLIQLPDGELKKFIVVALVYDTAFNLRYANIDNSDLQNIHISKHDYAGKEFVYLNLIDNVVHDKEPASTDWDIEGLRYAVSFPKRDDVISHTGIWINKGISVAKAEGVNVASNDYSSLAFTDSLDVIGWNWQEYDSATQIYHVRDSLAYFIQNQQGQVYKIIFTGFGGPLTGVMSFYSEFVSETTGSINHINNNNSISLFPDPANGVLNVATGSPSEAMIKVFDITGNLLSENKTTDHTQQINTAAFSAGLYLLAVSVDGQPAVYRKFVVSH